MRIISQDRMTDTPYDGAVVYIDTITDNQICVIVYVPDEAFMIGTYNSKEDAVYVMQLIREVCNRKFENFYMPKAEEVSSLRNELRGIVLEEGRQNAVVKKVRSVTYPLS